MHDFGRFQVDDAVDAEARRRSAGCGVDRVKATHATAEDDGRAMRGVARPVFDPAQRRAVIIRYLEDPFLCACGGVERYDTTVGRRYEHGVADDQRDGLR